MTATPKKAAEAKRINLKFSPDVSLKLQNLMELTASESFTEVIRKSLAIYEHIALEAEQNKAEVVLQYPDGKTKTLLIL